MNRTLSVTAVIPLPIGSVYELIGTGNFYQVTEYGPKQLGIKPCNPPIPIPLIPVKGTVYQVYAVTIKTVK